MRTLTIEEVVSRLDVLIARADLIAYILLLIVSGAVAVGVVYLLYRAIYNFMTR